MEQFSGLHREKQLPVGHRKGISFEFFGGVEGYKKAVLQWLGANEENGGKITGMGNDLLIDLEN